MEARENIKSNSEDNAAAAKVLDFILKSFATLGTFSIRLIAYFLDLTLLLLSDLIEKFFLEDWNWWQHRYETEETEEQYQIEILEADGGTRHEYKMYRSKAFQNLYNDLKSNIDVTKGVDLVLDKELSEDILLKVDRIVHLVEKEALNQGYKFAKETKGELEQEEIYQSYIINQIMTGK